MNVYNYFQDQLGVVPTDATLRELAVDSVCGIDCVRAIDACRTFLDCEEAAEGQSSHTIRFRLVARCDCVITTFWRG